MGLARFFSRAQIGIDAPLITIETHIINGLPSFNIVGLAEKTVKESKDRVRSALLNCQFQVPVRRIIVNLAPADLPKEGGLYDLPIALGILTASQQLPIDFDSQQYEFAGELALTGELRPVHCILPFAIHCKKANKTLIIPYENAQQASFIEDLNILPANHLLEVCEHICQTKSLSIQSVQPLEKKNTSYPCLSDVLGQKHVKRALEIAACGHHNLLMIGPPGGGKTMLASRLPGLLAPLTQENALEVAMIYAISHCPRPPVDWYHRPFRTPHHSASHIALVGGSNPPKPGEISLAHHGVLFLDEFPEFDRKAIEALRQPLESRLITISRAARQTTFPANFQLIAAMNPCPCGYFGDSRGLCRCTQEQVQRYLQRLSGPLLDRIDIHIEVPTLTNVTLLADNIHDENSQAVQARVLKAQHIQLNRSQILNADLDVAQLRNICPLSANHRQFLLKIMDKLHISARSLNRILKVARTIADLDNSEIISEAHLAEALGYRRLERFYY